MARAFDMQGAFNEVVLTLAPGASEPAVIAELDRLLEPWGGRGAYGRRDQPSHRFLEDELAEQRTLAITVPLVFFGIAAFLLNVVLGRLVEAQREQIAALKALGYPSLADRAALREVRRRDLRCWARRSASRPGPGWARACSATTGPSSASRSCPTCCRPGCRCSRRRPASRWRWLGVLAALRRILRLPAAEGLRPPRPAAFGGGALGRWGAGSARGRRSRCAACSAARCARSSPSSASRWRCRWWCSACSGGTRCDSMVDAAVRPHRARRRLRGLHRPASRPRRAGDRAPARRARGGGTAHRAGAAAGRAAQPPAWP